MKPGDRVLIGEALARVDEVDEINGRIDKVMISTEDGRIHKVWFDADHIYPAYDQGGSHEK